MSDELDQLAINTIRTLSIDAVQQANSGHPGTPMALAPAIYTIWNRVMNFDPGDPIWPNRDRFVLSNGHASMLLWALLFLTGTRAVNADYERLGEPAVSLEDIKRFRQLDSKAPGHPEYHWTSGVEATTGPLGQGVATSVGMAIAQKWLASRYNRPGAAVFDYRIYAVCGDGCMMEGVASEAASLAGHLGLDNLCWLYDNNHITIEGNTRITFTEDIAARFLGYGWNVLRVGDANDIDRIEHALDVFRQTQGRPTFIVLDSHIGYGAPHKQDTAAAHGEPLGEDEVRLAKRSYGWPEDAKFLVPDGVREHFAAGIGRARGGGQASVDRDVPRLRAGASGAGPRDRADAAARAPARMGPGPPGVPARRQRAGRQGRLRRGAQRHCAERSLVSRRLGGSGAIEQDHAQIPRRRRFPGREPRREEPAFRHPRARDGGDRQRTGAVQDPGLRRHLLHLQRLRPAGDPAVGPDGAARDLHLHA